MRAGNDASSMDAYEGVVVNGHLERMSVFQVGHKHYHRLTRFLSTQIIFQTWPGHDARLENLTQCPTGF
jgi:hypothetical protein